MAAPAQDLPPKGGFPTPVRYARNLPRRGPSGAVILVVGLGAMAYGFAQVGKLNEEKRELRREKTWARIHLVPLLQAESDRDAVRREEAMRAREAEVMKSVEGWVPG
ncbi:GRIM-19, partial [Hyaloraphidium curvatum]